MSLENENFMASVIKRCKDDSGFRAALKKADNPDTEYLSWEYLADYNVDLEKSYKRLPYVTVFAAVARSGIEKDGNANLGYALRMAYENDMKSEPARAKLRRLLSCDSVEEVCLQLHSLLKFISGKTSILSYQKLLEDLQKFYFNSELVRSRWAQEFFGNKEMEEE